MGDAAAAPVHSVGRAYVLLADYTTFRIGGPARRLVEVASERELIEEITRCDDAGEPVLVLGGGSNLVVADAGFDGTVLAIRTRGVRPETDGCSGATVEVAAGEPWDAFVARAVVEGWVGVELLSGIPGLVGATPVQNVGAYGQEVSDVVASVRTYDRRDRRVRTLAAAECHFGYRTSVLKAASPRFVVLAVTYQLRLGTLSTPLRYAELARAASVEPDVRVPLDEARRAVLALRARKGMVLDREDHDTWSAGSFFTNPIITESAWDTLAEVATARLGTENAPPRFPADAGRVKTSAAWLIERAGFSRGYGRGAARVSSKHTLALTNQGGASAADLIALADEIRAGVMRAFGIELENEPVLVGVELAPMV